MNKINQGIILFKMNRSLLSDYFLQNSSICSFWSSDSWVVFSPIELSIKQKIEAIGTPLKDWDINIYRGILTGYNEAFIISGEKRTELLAACETEKERIRTDELIRPILRGRDIKRYNYEFADLWLINTHNGIKEKGISRIDIDDYPTIKAHLDQYWDQISTRADKGDTPYNLRNCAYMDDFNKQKIVWKRIGSILRFCYDDTGCMGLDSTCFATGKHIKYLLAVLNSLIGHYLLKDSPQTGTGDLLISVQALEPIYIPEPSAELDNTISALIDKILDNDGNTQIQSIESQINQAILDVFQLTEEEIAFIKLVL